MVVFRWAVALFLLVLLVAVLLGRWRVCSCTGGLGSRVVRAIQVSGTTLQLLPTGLQSAASLSPASQAVRILPPTPTHQSGYLLGAITFFPPPTSSSPFCAAIKLCDQGNFQKEELVWTDRGRESLMTGKWEAWSLQQPAESSHHRQPEVGSRESKQGIARICKFSKLASSDTHFL